MGRQPKSNELKRLAGTNQPCRMSGEDSTKRLTKVSPPSYLSKQASKIFKDTAKQLIVNDVLTILDIPLLSAYASQSDIMLEALKTINEEGIITQSSDKKGNKTDKANPAVKVYNDSLKLIIQICSLLGLSPISRTNLAFVKSEKKESNKFSEFVD